MIINKFNYEVYALDYLEGKLSPQKEAEMKAFLKAHPSIDAELSDMMDLVILQADKNIVYENKAALLKENKTVYLNRKWLKPLMFAASIALLLITFALGYRAGSTQESNVIAANDIKSTSSPEIIVKDPPIKQVEQAQKKTAQKTINKKNITPNKFIKASTKPSENLVEAIVPVPKKTSNKKNSSTASVAMPSEAELLVQEKTAVAIIEQQEQRVVHAIFTLPTTQINTFNIESANKNLKNLDKELDQKIEIDEKILAFQSKKKRKFKDFLGKFPINDLKGALIPTYYKEEFSDK